MIWLNNWEAEVAGGSISRDQCLTIETAQGLLVTIRSTLDLCSYLIDRFDFKYLLTGKVNQDDLEVIILYLTKVKDFFSIFTLCIVYQINYN